MIHITPATYYRAAAACVAAAALSLTTTHHAAAQTVDLFGGTLGTPVSLSIGGIGNNTVGSVNGPFGPGFTGTLTEGIGVLNTLSEGFTANGGSNTFTISNSGLATAGGSTLASKTYTSALSPGGTYALTLTRTTGFTVGLLGSFNLTLSAGGTPFLSTTPGSGLLGAGIDLLGLFGSNGVESFQFTVPTNATGALGLTLTSTEPVGSLAGSYVFQSATLNAVPEPGSVAASFLGAAGLMALRFRRRLRAL